MTKLLWYKKVLWSKCKSIDEWRNIFWSEDGVCCKKANLGLSSRFKHGPLNTFFVIDW
jgi:hypothetical protein